MHLTLTARKVLRIRNNGLPVFSEPAPKNKKFQRAHSIEFIFSNQGELQKARAGGISHH